MHDPKQKLEEIKKAAFLHDLGKILNWAGELHPLEGGRILKFLGFGDNIVGAALYHQHEKKVEDLIIKNIKGDCAGLKAKDDYDRYMFKLSQRVDRLVSGWDRLGKSMRTKPIVLRNPITHLPLNGNFHQFSDAKYDLREFVRMEYLAKRNDKVDPDVRLKTLGSDNSKEVYELTQDLKSSQLLKVLVENKNSNFNKFYDELYNSESWRELTRILIPQGHHPPTDTLALWYHLQFSSALAGLYYLEGFRDKDSLNKEFEREENRTPLLIKVGLLYLKIKGVVEYFYSAYRIPDFTGSQEIAKAIKRTLKEELLKLEVDGLPIIWRDSFFYEGHDDFLVIIPVEKIGSLESDYVYKVEQDDKFLLKIKQTIKSEVILKKATDHLLKSEKLRKILRYEPQDSRIFGLGQNIIENLAHFISIQSSIRCFANFKNGNELTPIYGMTWNRLREEVDSRLPEQIQPYNKIHIGYICDSCNRNRAGHNPDRGREWRDKDWDRNIIKDVKWGDDPRPLRYWIFRSDSTQRGEGDKLCHACLLRRILGHGISLDSIAESESNERKSRLAVIKGNVNSTKWYIGGALGSKVPLDNMNSIYSKIWREEISHQICNLSLSHKSLTPFFSNVVNNLRKQIELAAPANSSARKMELPPPDLSIIGLGDVSINDIDQFLKRASSGNLFTALNLKGLFYSPTHKKWAEKDENIQKYYLDNQKRGSSFLSEAQNLIQETFAVEYFIKHLCEKFPNPWYPFSISSKMDQIVEYLFSGSPNFSITEQKDNDIPTPSRTMTVSWLINKAVKGIEDEVKGLFNDKEAEVIYTEGDEFLIICKAEYAPELAQCIFRYLISHLNSFPPEFVDELESIFCFPITVAMGMVIGKHRHPLYNLLELVDLLLYNAKNHCYKQNSIDFENVVGGIDKKYLYRDLLRDEWLSSRPISFKEFNQLLKYIEILHREKGPKRPLHLICSLMGNIEADPITEGEFRHASRKAAALAFSLKEGGEDSWQIIRRLILNNTFQDLLVLEKIAKGGRYE